MKDVVGSAFYRAPEITNKSQDFYNEKCDVYSLAIILMTMLNRRLVTSL